MMHSAWKTGTSLPSSRAPHVTINLNLTICEVGSHCHLTNLLSAWFFFYFLVLFCQRKSISLAYKTFSQKLVLIMLKF